MIKILFFTPTLAYTDSKIALCNIIFNLHLPTIKLSSLHGLKSFRIN